MLELRTIEKNRVEFDVEISPEAFAEEVKKVYIKERGRYRVDGFRPGKAPQAVIERMYGDEVFFDGAVRNIIPAEYTKAIMTAKLEPVSQPEYDVKKMSREEGFSFTVRVWIKPEVELGQYKGLEVEKACYFASDHRVDKAVQELLEKNARFEDVEDRPAKDGDKVIIDYKGMADGVAFPGGTAEKQSLDLGSGAFIPGFEEQVVGMSIGETKDLNVTFPEQYHNEELAGKDAVFTVTLHAIKEKQLPVADDEFASEVSEFDTMDELKEDMRKNIQQELDVRAENELLRDLYDQIMENSKVDIPEIMIQEQADFHMNAVRERFEMQGIPMEVYLQYAGTNMEDYTARVKKESEAEIRNQLVLEAIIKAEGIQVTFEDREAAIAKAAEGMSMTVEDFRKQMQPQDAQMIEDSILNDKLIEIIKGSANILELDKDIDYSEFEHDHACEAADDEPDDCTHVCSTCSLKCSSRVEEATAEEAEEE